jgi:phospholipid transport system substrate-binding protein
MHPAVIALLFTQASMTPTETIRARDAEIRAHLPEHGNAITPALRDKLEAILTRAVDLEAMAKAALGKHWDEQPKAKQKAFLDAFHTAFRTAIRGQVDFYKSSTTEFAPEERLDDRVKVPTTLVIKGEPTDVAYSMKEENGEWRIVDITIDDVSTVENYRASFAKIISQEGFDGLIARLKKKLAAEIPGAKAEAKTPDEKKK